MLNIRRAKPLAELDRGEVFEAEDRLNAASVAAFSVLFGLDDKVVPPQQSETMVKALRQRGVPVAYVELEGEGHGFRKAETIVRTLEAELYFYRRMFGLHDAGAPAPVRIDNLERPILPDEVGHENLDHGARRRPHGLHRPPKMIGPAVGQVVAGDARDHDVLQPEPPRRLGHPFRLVEFEFLGLTLGHRAEPARPRADIAENHERCRPLRPAFETVGALG